MASRPDPTTGGARAARSGDWWRSRGQIRRPAARARQDPATSGAHAARFGDEARRRGAPELEEELCIRSPQQHPEPNPSKKSENFAPVSSPGAAGGELEEREVERRVRLHGTTAAAVSGEAGSGGSLTNNSSFLLCNRRTNAGKAARRAMQLPQQRDCAGRQPKLLTVAQKLLTLVGTPSA
ncbi:hypothetical protein GUJ93_ZPchr0006g41241 [Zizania palustris]|uniref:Uncharacterized protein n=1 Tax=Zizania palustris TaxID=103762 RepID=A0A8J5TGD8_ZIZPA|nr:hypothetical protein GUJ93_ZPchr0006g41241 [Zizania palustris]